MKLRFELLKVRFDTLKVHFSFDSKARFTRTLRQSIIKRLQSACKASSKRAFPLIPKRALLERLDKALSSVYKAPAKRPSSAL